ncbi:MAG: haloacid dehalogenase [Hyphococcus sp.]|nr:MAG: haloacid dehalogenase [Marinicaulis sp.]
MLIRRRVSNLQTITGIGPLSSNYDAMLCDAWGVIHNGVALFDGVADALVRFREECGPVIILTNAPRPSSIIPGQLDRLGLPRAAYDAVVTSGDATRNEIIRRLPKPAYRIGPEKDDPLFEGLDIDFVELEGAGFIVCTGLVDDQHEQPEDYHDVLQAAAARNLEMICANPDVVVNWGGRMIWCAGALAQIYERLGGKVIYGGKPHDPIYRLAFEAVSAAKGRAVEKSRILAVGDGLNTDILGANHAGIDVLMVAGARGVNETEDGVPAVEEKLRDAGLTTIGVVEGLQW